MSYKRKDLSVIAYANGFTMWHYTTVDARADVMAVGYFDTARDMLRVGDALHCNVGVGGDGQDFVIVHVTSLGGSVAVKVVQ